MFEITKMKDLPKECMFFGYGSLMFPEGTRHRGMAYRYSDSDMFPVSVKGLLRGMFAEYAPTPRTTHRYYGLVEDPDSDVFGVIFKIHTKDDLIALLYDEFASPVVEDERPVYQLWDITDKFSDLYTGKIPKLTLLCKERKDDPSLYAPGYVEYVYEHLPDLWKADFLLSGGLHKC